MAQPSIRLIIAPGSPDGDVATTSPIQPFCSRPRTAFSCILGAGRHHFTVEQSGDGASIVNMAILQNLS